MTEDTSARAAGPSRSMLLFAIGAVVLTALSAGLWVWTSEQNARALARVGDEWKRLATCVVGDPAREDRAVVLRSAALQAASDHGSGEAAWPMRCDAHRDALASALDDVSADLFSALRTTLSEPSAPWAPRDAGLPPRIDHEAIERLWQAATVGDLPMTPADDVEGPALAQPIALRDAGTIRAAELTTEDAPGSDLRLLAPHEVCVIRASSPEVVACSALGEALRGNSSRTTRLLDAAEGASTPLVMVGSAIEAESGVFDATTGARIPIPLETYDAYHEPSRLLTLSLLEKRALLGRYDLAGHALSVAPIDGTDPAERSYDRSAPQLVADSLLWLARGRLYARGASEPTPHDLGAAPIESLPLATHACRTEGLLAIDLGGSAFVVRRGDEWGMPRVDPPLADAQSATLSCEADSVSAITVAHDTAAPAAITHLVEIRCTPERCERQEAIVPALGPLTTAPVALRLGDRVLLAFRRASSDGADAGVRMRLAPLADLARAPEVVLFDPSEDAPTPGVSSVDVQLAAYARGGQAWVLVLRDGEWIPIHVGSDGAFTAVRASPAPDAAPAPLD